MSNQGRPLQHNYIIAAMLLVLLLYSFMSQYLWYWITYALRDGRWVCDMIKNSSSLATNGKLLLAGIDGRLVWAASTFVLVIVLVSVVTVSIYILLSTLKQWRKHVVTIVTALLIGALLFAVFTFKTDYKYYVQVSYSGQDCKLASNIATVFDFVRYLLVLVQTKMSADTLNGIAVVEQSILLLVFVCNLMLIAALISLVAHNPRQLRSVQLLARRFGQFRLLIFMGSAMFTTIALYHMSQYGWFAQIFQADKLPGVETLRQIQRGVTLYIGTINSIAIVLLFFPPGWILWQYAEQLSQSELTDQSRKARNDWLADKQLTLFAGPIMRIIVAVAPLLVSGAIMLLEKALL